MVATNIQLVVPFQMPTTLTKAGGMYRGAGSPTSAFAPPKGSLYVKTDAATTTDRLWIATDDAGTWAYFTASA